MEVGHFSSRWKTEVFTGKDECSFFAACEER